MSLVFYLFLFWRACRKWLSYYFNGTVQPDIRFFRLYSLFSRNNNNNKSSPTYLGCSSPTEPCSCSLLPFSISTSNLRWISNSCHVLFLWWGCCCLSASLTPPIASCTSASVPLEKAAALGIRIWSSSLMVMTLFRGGGCRPPPSFVTPSLLFCCGTSYDVVSSLSDRILDVRLLAERLRVKGLWLFSLRKQRLLAGYKYSNQNKFSNSQYSKLFRFYEARFNHYRFSTIYYSTSSS